MEIIEISKKEGDISIKDLVLKVSEWCKYLLTKWIVIIVLGLTGGILGFLYGKTRNVTYTAATTFVLDDESKSGGLGAYAGLASIAGIDVAGGGGIFQGDNIIELYKSRTMIQNALLADVGQEGKKKPLIEDYINHNKLRKIWSDNPQLRNIHFIRKYNANNQEIAFSRVQDSILGSIASDINQRYLTVLKPDKKLSIIRAEVKSIDENFAKAFNEQIVKTVNDFYIRTRTKKSLNNVLILEQKADSVRKIMNGAIYSAAVVSDATPNLNPTRQVQRTAPIQRSQFSAEANKTILGELVKNLELSKISLRKETPLIQVIDAPILPLKKEKTSSLKAALAGAFIFGFLCIMYLSASRVAKEMFKQ